MEFLVVYSALLLIFVVVFAIIFGSEVVLAQAGDTVAARRDAQAVAAAINFAYLAGDGASYSFEAPRTGGMESITISDYTVTAKRAHATASAPLLHADVNASGIEGGNMTISNTGDGIDVAQ